MFQNIKPAFGSSGFGSGTTSTPFGQSPFGKPAGGGFSAPAFGSTPSSLFGSTATSAGGGVFGAASSTPVFGQAATTQSTGFGFGTSSTGTTNLFGNPQTSVGGTGLFGSTTTSAFGQNKPSAFGGFGTSAGTTGGGLFGQPQPSLFSQPASTGNTLFSSGFGNTAANTGTALVKFTPVTGTDTMMKGGVTQTINTRHYCITFMKEYENKSLEELRYEDYMAGRKGPQGAGATAAAGGLFQQPGSAWGSGAATNTGTGLFGSQPDKPALFSSANTGTSIGFGTGSNVFGAQGTQQTGLFGKTTGFGAATTSTGTGFAFNTTTNANPFVSQANKPFGSVAPQTGLFGTATSQPSTGFGAPASSGFGAFGSQQNQTQNIGLFGQNKTPFSTATTSTGFSFGQNAAQGSSLFAKPTVPSFGGFGASTGFGTGIGNTNLFNTSTAGATPSLFGQNTFKPGNTQFGFNTTTSNALGTGLNLGTGQSLFGQTNKPGGLFSSGTGTFGSSGFGSNTGALGTGLSNPLLGGISNTGFGQTPAAKEFPNLQDKIQALTQLPYGNQPLFRNTLPATGKADELLKPIKHNPEREAQFSQFKVGGANKIRVRPWGQAKKSLFEGLDDDSRSLTFTLRPSPKRLLLSEKLLETQVSSTADHGPLLDGPNKENTGRNLEHNSNIHAAGSSQPDNSSSDKENMPRLINSNANVAAESQNKKVSSENEFGSTPVQNKKVDSEQNQRPVSEPLSERLQQSSLSADNITISDISGTEKSADPVACVPSEPHPAGIVLTRAGYYTIPSLEELADCIEADGSCIVENFTVGREGYGNVFFPDRIDVSGLNLDEIVHFRHKEVLLYPDDSRKPPVGEGLNRRAQVTLDRVWPQDKSNHELIRDPDTLVALGFEEKLRRVCARMNARFLEYRPQTGSWVFKVESF